MQALRGTYSVVRKIAMLDLRHDAEYLARHVFASFPGLHELLPANRSVSDLDLFDPAMLAGERAGPGHRALRAAAGAWSSAWRRRMRASRWWWAATALPPPGVALRDGDFEYEYSLQGDGTVPIELARLPGARHSYVECGHSDLPLADNVHRRHHRPADHRRDAAFRRLAAAAPGLAHARARRRAARAVPGKDRLAAHDAGTAPAVPRHPQRTPPRPPASPAAAARGAPAAHLACGWATWRMRAPRPRPWPCCAACRPAAPPRDIDEPAGGVIGDWLQHRVVSGDAGHVTPIPGAQRRSDLQRRGRAAPRAPPIYSSDSAGFDRLSLDVIEHAAENLARFAEPPQYRSLATVAWGAHSGIAPADSFAAQLRGLLRARGRPDEVSRGWTCTCSTAPMRSACRRAWRTS